MARGIGWTRAVRRRNARRRELAESIAAAVLANRNLSVDVVCLSAEDAQFVMAQALDLLRPMVMDVARKTA